MPKVLISDRFSQAAQQAFTHHGIQVDVRPGLSADELKAVIGDYDGLAVRSGTKVTAELLDCAPKLKVIGRAGIGTDNIDLAAATDRGVVVMNTPYGNSVTTAEHAIAMMFALARQIPAANASTHQGKWEKSKFLGVELTGKTLGIVGSGNIGAIVANRALGIGMRVIAFDPFLSEGRAHDMCIEKVDLPTLFARADFISLHTPLTEATRNLICADSIALMKDGVRIVNCARGGLINEADLRDAILSGKVAGAALDVYQVEPATANPLFGLEQVVCTPHLGASTAEAQENQALQVAEQMSDFLLSGIVANALNMAAISAEDAPKLKPYLKLAEQLGSFAGQLTEHAIKAVEVEYEGHVASLNTKPLTAVVLASLLRPMMESVNMVNAPLVAKARGIEVSEVTNERTGDYNTLLRVTLTTEQRSRSVAGTLFGGDKPRVVEIKGIPIEAELGSHMLYVTNQDKPGFIGALGSLLGAKGVNIATFHLGRAEAGGDAILLTQVDQPLTDEILEAVRSLPHVVQAKSLSF
ncbi:MAG: phosphoglycerate dehydrogenase [Magnetospirillum sp.]|nr:phosphoglycerate dehydrogenase [Magnetospirillum sp.]